MPNTNNPYASSPDLTDTIASHGNRTRWANRLTVGLIGLPVFVLLALPAVQASSSTSLHDRSIRATESLVILIPGIVLIPAIAVSTIRLANTSISARRVAMMLLIVALLFDAWLCAELIRGF